MTSEEFDSLELHVAGKIKQMSQSEAWQYMQRDMENRRAQLQSEINTIGDNQMIYTGKDVKIVEIKLLDEILSFPANYLSRIVMKRQKIEQMDAYADSETEEDLF